MLPAKQSLCGCCSVAPWRLPGAAGVVTEHKNSTSSDALSATQRGPGLHGFVCWIFLILVIALMQLVSRAEAQQCAKLPHAIGDACRTSAWRRHTYYSPAAKLPLSTAARGPFGCVCL